MPDYTEPSRSGLQPRRRKYGGKLCTDEHGVLYDSQKERERAWELNRLLVAGLIDWWSYGPRYVLVDGYATPDGKRVSAVTYRPDFIARLDGVTWVEDVKGVKTREFMMKKKMWGARYPNVELRVL